MGMILEIPLYEIEEDRGSIFPTLQNEHINGKLRVRKHNNQSNVIVIHIESEEESEEEYCVRIDQLQRALKLFE